MASRQELERVTGRVLSDADFRQRLLKDPEGAARGIDVALTQEQADRIKGLDADKLESLAADFLKLIGPGLHFLW